MTDARYIYRVDFIGKDSLGADTTFRFATRGYQTSPAHATLPNTAFQERVTQALLFRRDMYGELKTYGSTEIAHGECRLGNEDGGLDYLMAYAFDIQEFLVIRVDPSDYDSETIVFRGVLEQLRQDADQLVLLVRDLTYVFDRTLQTTKYLGTSGGGSGVEGADDLEGRPKPVLFGQINFQGKPILVNPAKLIYQVDEGHAGRTSIKQVWDAGVSLTQGSQYASQADMEATAPAAGGWRTLSGSGLFRLGSTPVGKLCFSGENEISGFTDIIDAIEWCLQRFSDENPSLFPGGIGLDVRIASGFLDAGFVGIHATEETTYLRVLREFFTTAAASFHFYPYTNSPAKPFLTIEHLSSASLTSGTVALSITEGMVKTGSLRLLIPNDETKGIPAWRVHVGYSRRAVLMGEEDIAGGVTSTAFLDREYKLRSATLSSVKTQFPAAPEVTVTTPISLASGLLLSTLVTHLGSRLTAVRQLFSLIVPMAEVEDLSHAAAVTGGPVILGPRLSMRVTLTHSKFNLSSGKNMLLLGYVLDYAADECELILWG